MVGSNRALTVAAALLAVVGMTAPATATEVLVLNSEEVLANSAAGTHIRERLEAIGGEMETELEELGAPLQERWQALQERTADMTPEELQEAPEILEEGRELQTEIQGLSAREQIFARELVATRVQALRPVREALDTVLEAIVEERGADILIERSSVIFASDDANITSLVIERLDAEISEVDVERVRIPLEESEGDDSDE